MTNPHNVDICVTCVSEKPPQLPLREELPSLGIEVIYNAHGVGAKASKHESKKLIKKFREKEQVKELKSPRFFPSSPKKVEQKQKDRERQESMLRVPHALSYNSYQKRLNQDQGEATQSSSSVSSWETHSTAESSNEENKVKKSGWGRFRQKQQQGPISPTMKKNDMKPPKTVDIPTHSPEELALKEAFNVFSDTLVDDQLGRVESRETHKTPSSRLSGPLESRDQSSDIDPSTLTTKVEVGDVPNQVRVVASRAARGKLPGLTSTPGPSSSASGCTSSGPPTTTDNSTLTSLKNTATQNLAFQVHSTPAVQDELPHLRVAEPSPTSYSSMVSSIGGKPQGGSIISSKSEKIKMKMFNTSASQVSEFFDLTEISDDEGNIVLNSASEDEDDSRSKDLSTLSSKKETSSMSKDLSTVSSKKDPPVQSNGSTGVQVYPSAEIQKQLPGLRLHIPEMDDGYGRILLDLSDVGEERGPGSPLVYKRASEARVIHSPHKRSEVYDRMSDLRMIEERQDDDIMESPTYPTRHHGYERDDPLGSFLEDKEVEDKLAYKNGMKSLFDDASSNGKSFSQLASTTESFHADVGLEPKEEFVIYSPRKSFSKDSDNIHVDLTSDSEDRDALEEYHATEIPQSSFLQIGSATHDPPGSATKDLAAPLSPVLKNVLSRDSEAKSAKMSVSFSHDVEEHYVYYDEDEFRDSILPDRRENITSYEDCFKLLDEDEKKQAIREDVEDLPADLSDDADEAFEALRAKLSSSFPIDDLYEAKYAEKNLLDERETEQEDTRSPEVQLLEALSYGTPLPAEFEKTLERNPDLARNKLPASDRYPLQAACVRGFPCNDDESCRVTDLVSDVVAQKNLIAALVSADPASCRRVDREGDLPVHIMARQLMEWEARWYQKVYEKAREDSDEQTSSGAGITTLYQTMSQCVDLLLGPVSIETLLCKQPGSIGKLLPLHIAAIFTVSYDTLKALLEEYPEAATEKCDLGDMRTFIPNDSIPLELHNRLSTDFPKWEIENHSEPEEEIQWTQANLDKSYGTKGGMRRSDLMFAFNPDVPPHRHETLRIRRFESRIRCEVTDWEGDDDLEISQAAKRLWTWICTFEAMEDEDDHYADSVKRIIQSLPARSVKLLAAMPTDDGKPVVDKAIPQVTKVFRERFDEIAEAEVPVPVAMLSSGFASNQRSFLLRQWDENMASRFCLQGRGFVGVLCRTLFNITESTFPSSFVFLPYKLVKDGEGRLGLESAEAAATAMQFADCLLHLTDAKKILHFLEKKAVRFLGTSLGCEDGKEWEEVENDTKEQVNKLLSLYQNGPAYFYFLDEYTGVPIVSEKKSIYPLVVGDAVDIIRKVLPLMLSGMILMRGEKALPIIANVLLNQKVSLIQNHWIDAAKDLAGYLYSPQTEWTNTYLQDLRPLRDDLVEFIETGASDNAPEPGHTGLASEWVVELSLVKMIVKMHDSNLTYAGIKPRRAGLKTLWTRDAAFLDPASRDHLFQVDFKSLLDLKDMTSEKEEEALEALQKDDQEHQLDFDSDGRSSPELSVDGYELLFRELSLVETSSNSGEQTGEEKEDSRELLSRDQEPVIVSPPQINRQLKYASVAEPISLLNFEDDLDLDDVLQLRILLDEQEAKLEFLREKIDDLEVGEEELLDQEERLGDLLDEINNNKNNMLDRPSNSGLSKARKLLLRICELEDRVLCREVEVGQLKNDISCFELEASNQGHLDVLLLDDI
jgi:hypothetical protein